MTSPDIQSKQKQALAYNSRTRDLLTSEWTKFYSVRSTYWTLLIAAVTAIGGSAVVASASANGGKTPFDPLASIFVGWLEYPVLAFGILGVLAFTSEYSSGIIRTTFTAVPQRRTVLAAKFGVVGIVTLVFGEFLAFASLLLSEVVRGSRAPSFSIFHADVVGAVLAAGFSLFAIAMMGLAIGAIARHTAGAIAVLPALIYLPLLVLSLPSPWNDRIGGFTILMAAYQSVSLHPQAHFLSPTLSILVLAAWAFIPLLVAAIAISRRDM